MTTSEQERQKSGLKTLLGLLPFLSPYKLQFVIAGLALVVAAGSTLAIPYAFRQMIDQGFGAGSAEHINQYFLALFGVACVTWRFRLPPASIQCHGWVSA
jgi:ATP-binding cassette subfamily B protein